MTLKFELGRDVFSMHLSPMFHHPMFTRSEVIMLTHKHTHPQTHKQTDAAENIQVPTFFTMLRRWVNTADS